MNEKNNQCFPRNSAKQVPTLYVSLSRRSQCSYIVKMSSIYNKVIFTLTKYAPLCDRKNKLRTLASRFEFGMP